MKKNRAEAGSAFIELALASERPAGTLPIDPV